MYLLLYVKLVFIIIYNFIIIFSFSISLHLLVLLLTHTHTHTPTILHLSGLCPEQPGWAGTRRYIIWYIFWIFWCKLKITQADAPTIRMVCHPIQTNWCPHLCHPHNFYARCPSWHNLTNLSWLGTGTKYAGLRTWWHCTYAIKALCYSAVAVSHYGLILYHWSLKVIKICKLKIH